MILRNIEDVLDFWLPENPGGAWTAGVFPGLKKKPEDKYLRALTLPARDLLSRGGKRWRPLLMSCVCEALGGGDASLPLAPLVEFSHNASLIHDDIEDNSDERRGKPAVHLLYGADTAINSGSFLYFLPLSCVAGWAGGLEARAVISAETAQNRVYSLWGEYMRRLHTGQAMDIGWHRDFSSLPAVDEYLVMCALKTGCLARFAAVLGVCAAAALNSGLAAREQAVAETLGEAAENLGVGFQILDDVKNLRGGIPGKKRGDDIVEGKKSLPLLLFLHRYPQRRDFAARCVTAARANGTEADEVEDLIQALESAGVLDEAREQGLARIAGAEKVFDSPSCGGYPLREEERRLLSGLAGLLG